MNHRLDLRISEQPSSECDLEIDAEDDGDDAWGDLEEEDEQDMAADNDFEKWHRMHKRLEATDAKLRLSMSQQQSAEELEDNRRILVRRPRSKPAYVSISCAVPHCSAISMCHPLHISILSERKPNIFQRAQ